MHHEHAEALQWLAEESRRRLLIESAGLFWLAAEVAILWAVWLAWRRVAAGRTRLWPLTAYELGAGALGLATLALLSAYTLARHVQPGAALAALNAGAPPPVVADAFRRVSLEHLALWSWFVLGWVVLEAVIVYTGWRAYRTWRMRLV